MSRFNGQLRDMILQNQYGKKSNIIASSQKVKAFQEDSKASRSKKSNANEKKSRE